MQPLLLLRRIADEQILVLKYCIYQPKYIGTIIFSFETRFQENYDRLDQLWLKLISIPTRFNTTLNGKVLLPNRN